MTDAVRRTLEFDVSPERVWRALTDPEELSSWFPDETRGLDVRPGAEGWWHWEAHGSYAVRFEVVDGSKRLVWVWARDPDVGIDDGPTTRVEWRLEPRNGGRGTRLHLREDGFLTPEARGQNEEGWNQELDELRRHLAGAA